MISLSNLNKKNKISTMLQNFFFIIKNGQTFKIPTPNSKIRETKTLKNLKRKRNPRELNPN